MYKIMLVEDDLKIAAIMKQKLEQYTYEAEVVTDFQAIDKACDKFLPHMILLDINLPYFDGYYWCRQIRKKHSMPIIFISARSGEMEQIMAIENGGDDYMTKTVQLDLMIAKIRSHLRRCYGEYANSSTHGQTGVESASEVALIEQHGISLSLSKHELSYNGKVTDLTKNECLLAECLLKEYGKVISRDQLLEALWDDVQFVEDNTLTVNMTRLRRKLSEIGLHEVIETIRGQGYKFKI